MTVGNRLRNLRLRKGLTMAELAKLLDSATTTISNYETDRRNPPYDMLKRMAIFYDVTVDYILGITENPNIYKEVENIPDEVKETGVEYIYFAKEMQDKKISIDKMKKIMQAMNIIEEDE